MKTDVFRLLVAGSLLVATVVAGGCRETVGSRLVGRWEGRPDSAEAFIARHQTAATELPDAPALPMAPPYADTTELQRFDFRVVLELGADHSAAMWRDEDGQRLAGRWHVAENNGDRMVLEIAAERQGQPPTTERRRFLVEWENDRRGFTLWEEGADPQLGWLFFQRAEP